MMNSANPIQADQLSATDVTSGLNAVLNTDKFMASPQMSAFLKYVVEQTLIGNTRRIKAFTVGIEALGKPASFDPQTDPSVRVLAKRLRSSLDTYYAQNPETELFIEMKPGSYVPKFLRRSEMPTAMPVNTHSAVMPEQAPASSAYVPAERHSSLNAATNDNAAHANEVMQQPMESAGAVPMNNEAHLSVQQTSTALTKPNESDSEDSTSGDDNGERKTNLSQLWQGYKSASKVA